MTETCSSQNETCSSQNETCSTFPGARCIFLYGSTLSPQLRRPDSVPDAFAIVEDLAAALLHLGEPRLARWSRHLIPPITIARNHGKLSLMTWGQAEHELAAGRDLYLAGRLSKKIQLLHGQAESLVEAATSTVVEAAALELPRRTAMEEAVLRCLGISYRGEVRPEGPEQARRLFAAFPDFYWRRFSPLVEAHARSRGIDVRGDELVDRRPEPIRQEERRRLQVLLIRSRRRAMLRWPQQLVVYRGSIGYVVGKLRRSWDRFQPDSNTL